MSRILNIEINNIKCEFVPFIDRTFIFHWHRIIVVKKRKCIEPHDHGARIDNSVDSNINFVIKNVTKTKFQNLLCSNLENSWSPVRLINKCVLVILSLRERERERERGGGRRTIYLL